MDSLLLPLTICPDRHSACLLALTGGSEKLKFKNDSHEGQKVCKSRSTYGIVGDNRRDKLYMAFEADRFNHSRTSQRRTLSRQHSAGSKGESFAARAFAKQQKLTTVLKERLQQFCAAARKNSAANLQSVIHLRMIQNLHHGTNGPGFGVV